MQTYADNILQMNVYTMTESGIHAGKFTGWSYCTDVTAVLVKHAIIKGSCIRFYLHHIHYS